MPIGGGYNWTLPLLQQINRQGDIMIQGHQLGQEAERNALQKQVFNLQIADKLNALVGQNALREALMTAGGDADLEATARTLIQSGRPEGLELLLKAKDLQAKGGYSLKPGEKRFDASGREISTGGPEPFKDEYSRAAGRQLSLDELIGAKTRVAEAGRPSIQFDVNKKGMTAISEKMGEELIKEREKVQAALSSYAHLQDAKALLDKGIITGKGATLLTEFGNALSTIGIKAFDEPVANTQAFVGTMGRQVGENIKMFGSGTGLSDADRQYAEKMAAGQIELNEIAIRKIIDINQRQTRWIVKQYNDKADQAMKREGAEQLPYDLRIDAKQLYNTNDASKTKNNPSQNMPKNFKTPDEVKAAYKAGTVSKENAAEILRNQFGME